MKNRKIREAKTVNFLLKIVFSGIQPGVADLKLKIKFWEFRGLFLNITQKCKNRIKFLKGEEHMLKWVQPRKGW